MHATRLAPLGAILAIVFLAGCGGAAPPEGNARIAIAGSDLVANSSLVITATKGSTIVQKTTIVSSSGAILFFSLAPGRWDFTGTLTPPGATTPTHAGSVTGVLIGTAPVNVQLTLVRVLSGNGVTVTVGIDDHRRGIPTAITAIHIDPSTRVYGGEEVTLFAESTDPTLRLGWRASSAIVLNTTGGAVTGFTAPTALGSYTVSFFVDDGSDVPASLDIAFQVVAGGLIGVSALPAALSVPGTAGLAWDGTEYAVASTDEAQRQVLLARLSAGGDAIGAPILVRGSTLASPGEANWDLKVDLIWNGSAFNVLYDDPFNDPASGVFPAVYMAHVLPSGDQVFKDLTASTSLRSSFDGNVSNPALAWMGDRFAAVWSDSRAGKRKVFLSIICYGAQPCFDGPSTDSPVADFPDDANILAGPTIAWSGRELGVAWTEFESSDISTIKLRFARVSQGGVPLSSTLVSTACCVNLLNPSLVWTGSGYALAYPDVRAGDAGIEIYLTQLSPAGARVATDARVTNPAARVDSSFVTPSLTWTGQDFGVTWLDSRFQNSREVRFIRFRPGAANRPDIRLTPLLGDRSNAKMIYTGDTHALVFQDFNGGFPAGKFARIGDPQ